MGLGRLELPTLPLSGVRSSQLSYRPEGYGVLTPLRAETRGCEYSPYLDRWHPLCLRTFLSNHIPLIHRPHYPSASCGNAKLTKPEIANKPPVMANDQFKPTQPNKFCAKGGPAAATAHAPPNMIALAIVVLCGRNLCAIEIVVGINPAYAIPAPIAITNAILVGICGNAMMIAAPTSGPRINANFSFLRVNIAESASPAIPMPICIEACIGPLIDADCSRISCVSTVAAECLSAASSAHRTKSCTSIMFTVNRKALPAYKIAMPRHAEAREASLREACF